MKRVAVFGNSGGGKSTLARKLAELTRLPLYPLDLLEYRAGGAKVPRDEFLRGHAALLQKDEWIIDGFGGATLAWERFSAADTLVYLDLPLMTHYWWVTKRLLLAPLAHPEGWPEDSPLWRSTISCYRVIWLCHRMMTPRYRQLVADAAPTKRVHHLRSATQMAGFLDAVRRERG
jgi:adenylate kinase family enzyme